MNLNKRISRLANKAFIVVFIAYMLDVAFARLVAFGAGLYVAPVFLVAKTFFYGGIFATCVNFLIDERYQLDIKGFLLSCKKYFWTYIAYLALIIVVDMVFSFNLNYFNGWDFLYAKNHFQILTYPLIAFFIVKAKKLQGNEGCSKSPPIEVKEFLLILVLYFIDVGLFYIPQFIDLEEIEIARVTLLFSKYIQLYLFLYLGYFAVYPYRKTYIADPNAKELYLINPKPKGFLSYIHTFLYPKNPWLFFVLKALTPKDYAVKTFSNVDLLPEEYMPGKLVAITSFSSNAYEAYSIAKKFRARGSKVIMGGAHAGFLPDEALCFCDSVVIGEAESVWDKIIQDYENDRLQQKYYGEPRDNFYEKVDEYIIDVAERQRIIQIETTRGCKFSCDFCVIPSMTFKKIRHRPIENVIKILENFKMNKSTVLFLDNNIYAEPKYSIELFKALEKMNISWSGSASIDIAKDDEVLDLVKRSGCIQLLIGYEIAAVSIEKEKKGKFSMADQYLELSKKIMKKGIQIDAQFIFGFEKDNYKSLLDLWKFCFKLRPTITSVGLLTPLPGSKLYQRMLEQDKLLNLNWSSYSLDQIVFEHKNLNEKLTSFMAYVITLFYFFSTSSFGIKCFVAIAVSLFVVL